MKHLFTFLILTCSLLSCNTSTGQNESEIHYSTDQIVVFDSTYKVIHVMVALCDNKYQGIVPVPKKIGNGQDPDNNLYWGCGYGIRTYFKKSKEWKEVLCSKPGGTILERIVFKHKIQKYYLVADAYDGKEIKQCTKDFLSACSGQIKDTLGVEGNIIGITGNSCLISYIGHDGLMDFSLNNTYESKDGLQRDAIILACISKSYFSPYLKKANTRPLVWTTGLMCPEAYTLHAALNTYIAGGDAESIRTSAANAYHKYQKCGEKAARKLLVTGF